MDKGFNFEEKIRLLEHTKVQLPRTLGLAGELYFQQNFDKAQWNGQAWEPRKDDSNTHALLVRTGRLRQAMQRSLKSYNWNEVKWKVAEDVKYSAYLNEGTDRMPARTFIGDAKELEDIFMKKIDQAIMRILDK